MRSFVKERIVMGKQTLNNEINLEIEQEIKTVYLSQ